MESAEENDQLQFESYSDVYIRCGLKGSAGNGSSVYDCDGVLIRDTLLAEADWKYTPAPPGLIRKRQTKGYVRKDKRYVFVGNLSIHFGHFLLETISSFHIVIAGIEQGVFRPGDKWLFFSSATHQELNNAAFIHTCFDIFGINWPDVEVVNRSFCARELLVPKRCMKVKNDFGGARMYNSRPFLPYKLLRSFLHKEGEGTRRVYFTRKNFNAGQGARRVENELMVEEVFSNFGFEIVSPEALSFSEQISIASDSEWLAGFEGSAMHLSAFQPKGGNVITINKRKEVYNQDFFNSISSVNHIILDRAEYEIGKEKRKFYLDLDFPFIHKSKRGVIIDSDRLYSTLKPLLSESA